MKAFVCTSSLWALLFCSSVIAIPFDGSLDLHQLTARQTNMNCADSYVSDPSCWESLNVEDFLISWYNTTPKCTDTEDGTNCCGDTESWSTCLLRLSHGFWGLRCDLLGRGCESYYAIKVPDLLDPQIQYQALYVNRAMSSIHQLFASFSEELGRRVLIGGGLQEILAIDFDIDSDEIASASILLNQLSIPMTLGLSIANLTAWNNSEIAPIARLWSSAIRAAPKVQQILWGSNPAANAQNQSLQANQTIGNDTDLLLQEALGHIMSDIPSFLDFAAEGRFVSGNGSGLPFDLDLAAGVETFVLSKLMQMDEIYAVPGPLVDETAYAAFVEANAGSLFFRSPSTRRQYEVRAKGHGTIELRSLLGRVLGGRLADPQLLFDGNYNCTWAGWAGGSIVNRVGVVGGGDVACLSQLPMYLEKGTPCPTDVLVGGKCPFGYLG